MAAEPADELQRRKADTREAQAALEVEGRGGTKRETPGCLRHLPYFTAAAAYRKLFRCSLFVPLLVRVYSRRPLLRFRVGDLDLTKKRRRNTNSGEEEDVTTNMCLCGTIIESRSYILGECEIFKEEWDALEEKLRKLYVCDMEKFRRLERSEKTIDILGDRWWPQTAKQDGDRISKLFLRSI